MLCMPSRRRAWSVEGARGWTVGHQTGMAGEGAEKGSLGSLSVHQLSTSVGKSTGQEMHLNQKVKYLLKEVNNNWHRTILIKMILFFLTWRWSRMLRALISLIISSSLGSAGWWCFFETLFSHSKWRSYSFRSECSFVSVDLSWK